MGDEPTPPRPSGRTDWAPSAEPAERIAVALEGINHDMVAIRRRLAPSERESSTGKNAWVLVFLGMLIGLIAMSLLEDRDKMPKGLAP